MVCIGAGSPLQPPIEALRGKLVRSHPIAVIAIAAGSPVSPCHVLFVDDALPERLRRRLETHSIPGVPTVSDQPDFARRGGDIGLYYENNRLRFEINIRTAGESGIAFSSKLLPPAVVVGRQSSRLPATNFALFSSPRTGRHVLERLRA